MLCVVSSYRLLYRLISSCRSCLSPVVALIVLWHLLQSVVVPVACLLWSCYLIARSGHRLAPVGTIRRPDTRPSGGGGDFSKRGEGQTETNPVPIFMRKVKKNVVFQRKKRGKWGEFEEKENKEKRVRKRE